MKTASQTRMHGEENDVARCCASFYEKPVVSQLMGDSFHPGGLALSRRLFEQLALPPGSRVLDLACGAGTTAIDLATKYDVNLVGVDFSHRNLALGRERGEALVDGGRLEFVHAQASALPFESGTFDAVLCECAVSTFSDKPVVATEIARVLREGGQLGMSDMVVEDELPPEIAGALGPWACVEDALSAVDYRALFVAAGLSPLESVDESPSLVELANTLKRRLVVLGLGQVSGAVAELDMDLAQLRQLLGRAKECVEERRVQYWRFAFSKGAVVRGDGPAELDRSCCPSSTGCC